MRHIFSTKVYLLFFNVICFHQIHSMGHQLQPISMHAYQIISTIYQRHGLSKEIEALHFGISNDDSIVPEVAVQKNHTLIAKKEEKLIGWSNDGLHEYIFLSPAVNKLIELSELNESEGGLKTSCGVIYNLLNMVGQRDYLKKFPQTSEDKTIHIEGNKFAIGKMSIQVLEQFKKDLETSDLTTSNFGDGLLELLSEELKFRKKFYS